jgi:hypothetical protein
LKKFFWTFNLQFSILVWGPQSAIFDPKQNQLIPMLR